LRNVALFGQMYAGKSTIADALGEAGYHRMSFAGPLKNVAALAYGTIDKTGEYETMSPWEDAKIVTPAYSTSTKSGRQILQEVGQAMKMVDRDFWLKCFFRDAKNYLDTPLTVDDGRFLFEFDALRSQGWLSVGILTPDTVRWQRAISLNGREPTPAEKNHPSETEIPSILAKCDLVVDGTTDPYANAKRILDVAR